ncbi:MAG: tyrosinase family protein [Rhizomicrobium sp.]|jgi:hypothetical protein
MLNRRDAMMLLAASGLLASPARSAPRIVLRQSVNSMDSAAPEMDALRKAIPLMRQSGYWDRLVEVHNRNWNQHHSWLFLPWHRMFLYQFERAVRRLTYDDFRMPYLDWDADHIPPTLYDPPFDHPGRTHGTDDSMREFQGAAGLFSLSAPRSFYGFFGERDYGGDDESYGHNLVHVFVGGDMGVIATAPRDPLFWFHHSNVDRLWWYWSGLHQCQSQPCYPDDWLDEQIRGVTNPEGETLPPVAVRSLLWTQSLGYDYNSLPVVRMARPGQELAAPGIYRTLTHALRLLDRPSQSTMVSLPKDLLLSMLAASRVEVDAPLRVRSASMEPHEIRISLVGRNVLQAESIFAMPMGMSEAGCSYVKDIGSMFNSLAKGLSRQAAIQRIAAEPFGLRVEAMPLKGATAREAPKLTQCTCAITARVWS